MAKSKRTMGMGSEGKETRPGTMYQRRETSVAGGISMEGKRPNSKGTFTSRPENGSGGRARFGVPSE
jgi:hypothetical protein